MRTFSSQRWLHAALVALLGLVLLLSAARLGLATTTISAAGATTPTGTAAVSTTSPTPTSGETGGTQTQGNQGKGGGTPGDNAGLWTKQLCEVLGIIALCGAIGGMADGLRTNLRYRLMIPGMHRVRYRVREAGTTPTQTGQGAAPAQPAPEAGEVMVSESTTFTARELELGFLGDAMVGVVAAFSVFVVSSAMFPGATEQDVVKISLVHLIGWALVAGYLGPRLMRLITDKIANIEAVKQTANQASSDASAAMVTAESGKRSADAAKATVKASEESHPLIVEAQRLLTVNEVAGLMKGTVPPEKRKSDYLDKAEEKYKLALALHPGSASHLVGLANVYYDMAELAAPATKNDPRTVPQLWQAGVETLEKALKAEPASAKARYNLACFKAKANAASAPANPYPEAGIFEDLKAAYGSNKDYQAFAFTDPDFKALRERKDALKPEDLALIKGPDEKP